MWRKTAQKAEISQMSIFWCFFEDTGSPVSEPAGFTAATSYEKSFQHLRLQQPEKQSLRNRGSFSILRGFK
jgi:hypothetical protein